MIELPLGARNGNLCKRPVDAYENAPKNAEAQEFAEQMSYRMNVHIPFIAWR